MSNDPGLGRCSGVEVEDSYAILFSQRDELLDILGLIVNPNEPRLQDSWRIFSRLNGSARFISDCIN